MSRTPDARRIALRTSTTRSCGAPIGDPARPLGSGHRDRYRRCMSAQRARSAAAADHRSIHRSLPGLPWWTAIVLAVTATAAGFAFDARSDGKELTGVFAALYVRGCVAAVLTVRQSGVFTAVIQPPLILFCAVPGAYWLFHVGSFTGIKEALIDCGYPLIERFPLMLFTSAGVLLIGLIRWYVGTATRAVPQRGGEANDGPGLATVAQKVTAKFNALFNRDAAHAVETSVSHRRRASGGRPRRTPTPRRDPSSSAPTRSRHVRPPVADTIDPSAERSRRRRTAPVRDEDPPPRRRRRPPPDLQRPGQSASRARRDPHLRTGEPTARGNRRDSYQPVEPNERSPRRRQTSKATHRGTDASSATHHPVSRVRYRGTDPTD